MRFFRFKRKPQRFARAQQMGLPDHFIERARAQLLGKRRAWFALAEQVTHE
jgi:hypothetical protein